MREARPEEAWEPEIVSPGNSTASNTELIQDLVNALASNYREVQVTLPHGRGPQTTSSRGDLSGVDLELYNSWLSEAHGFFRDASLQKAALSYASEWVLDNYYIIRQALQQIKEDLPSGYYRQLPKLTHGPMKDLPRIYAIARAILSYQHLLLDPIGLQAILIQLQERVPLTMGELWALPIFLRFGLIEYLAYALVTVIHPLHKPKLPPEAEQLPGTVSPISTLDTKAGRICKQ